MKAFLETWGLKGVIVLYDKPNTSVFKKIDVSQRIKMRDFLLNNNKQIGKDLDSENYIFMVVSSSWTYDDYMDILI